MSEISIVPSDLRNTANKIREGIAAPFAKDMNDFYAELEDFVARSYVSDASREKEKQIVDKKELLQRMYNVMNEYANFLDEVASKFIKTDADNAANFTKM
jgi:RNA processing factor Prp31